MTKECQFLVWIMHAHGENDWKVSISRVDSARIWSKWLEMSTFHSDSHHIFENMLRNEKTLWNMILENLRNYWKIGGTYPLGGNVTFRGDLEVWMKPWFTRPLTLYKSTDPYKSLWTLYDDWQWGQWPTRYLIYTSLNPIQTNPSLQVFMNTVWWLEVGTVIYQVPHLHVP